MVDEQIQKGSSPLTRFLSRGSRLAGCCLQAACGRLRPIQRTICSTMCRQRVRPATRPGRDPPSISLFQPLGL